MLSPRLSECIGCSNILSLISKIDCKLGELAKVEYNNIIYSLNKPVQDVQIGDLLNYKRILTYKACNPDYACDFSVNMIASKIALYSLYECSCNQYKTTKNTTTAYQPPPITTSTTTSSTSSTTTTSSTSTSTTTTTTTMCTCYEMSVPFMIEGLILYIDCQGIEGSVSRGNRIADCVREITTNINGYAEPIVGGCCGEAIGCECVLPPTCYCYNVALDRKLGIGIVNYTSCDGNTKAEETLNSFLDIIEVNICAQEGTVSFTGVEGSTVTITGGVSECTVNGDCTTTTTTTCPPYVTISLGYDKSFASDACLATPATYYIDTTCGVSFDLGCILYTDSCLTTPVVSPGGVGGGYYSNGVTSWQYNDILGVVGSFSC